LILPSKPVENLGQTVEKPKIPVEKVGNLLGKRLKKNKNCKFLTSDVSLAIL
jgi:uncharacterized protein (UPF0210 family)